MNIRLDADHRLIYDDMGYTLYENKAVNRKDKETGAEHVEIIEIVEGYYGTLTQACIGLHRHGIQGSAAETVAELRRMEQAWAERIERCVEKVMEHDVVEIDKGDRSLDAPM